MLTNYNSAIDFVFKYEGGYANNPRDPGGPTNRGITLATARAFWKPDATAEDVKAMPKSVAESIYRKQYADKINFDSLPSGLDLCALDAAVMSGPARANKWLKVAKSVEEYQTLRLNFYKSLKIWPTFGTGWTNRINAGSLLANKLINTPEIGLPPKADTVPSQPKALPHVSTQGGIIATGGAIAAATPTHWLPYVIAGTAIAMVAGYILVRYYQYRHGQIK